MIPYGTTIVAAKEIKVRLLFLKLDIIYDFLNSESNEWIETNETDPDTRQSINSLIDGNSQNV